MIEFSSAQDVVNDFYSAHPRYRTKKKLIEMISLYARAEFTRGREIGLVDGRNEIVLRVARGEFGASFKNREEHK